MFRVRFASAGVRARVLFGIVKWSKKLVAQRRGGLYPLLRCLAVEGAFESGMVTERLALK